MKKMKLTLIIWLLLPVISMAQHFGGVGRGDYSAFYTGPVVVTATDGTAGPTAYMTLKAAFDAINLGTHQGAITVKINAGTIETASAVMNASGSGTSPNISNYTAVNIYPTATGITISGAIDGPLIDLDGADKVTLDGRVNQTGAKSLTIVNTSATVNNTLPISAIRFINSAENNKVKYCTFKANALSNTSGIILFSTASAGNGNSGNKIDNCDITQDASRPFQVVYSYGSSGYENKNDTVSNCNIYNFFNSNSASNGIFIFRNSTDWAITGNNLFETVPVVPAGDYAYYFIRVSNASGNNFTISDNFLGGTSSDHTGTWTVNAPYNHSFTGIFLNVGTITPSSVQNNTIQGINYTTKHPIPCYIMHIYAGAVNVGTSTGNTIGSAAYPITVKNSINNAQTYGIYTNSEGAVAIENNVISSFTTIGSATVAHGFCGIYKFSVPGAITISNNTIGSTASINSIQASSDGINYYQNVIGIACEGTGSSIISGNLISGLSNSYAGPGPGQTLGIYTTDGSNTISNNTVRDLSNASSLGGNYSNASVIGISQKSKVAGQTIAGNTIFNLSNINTGSVFVHNYGIYYSGPSTGTNTVSRNFIYNLTVAATNTAAVINGIRTEWGVTTYSNNIINLGSGLVIGYEVGGIFDDAGGNQASSFYYNTVYLGGTVIGAGSSTFAFSALLYATKSINLRNNIFYNGRSGGSAGMHYAIKLPGTTGLTIDYNDYYVPGTTENGALGYLGGDQTSLADWKIATGQDTHSLFADPGLPAAGGTSATNYKPTNTSLVAVTGTGVTTDYQGTITRSVTYPSMGAWEYAVTPPCANPTSGGTITASQTGCTSLDPAELTGSLPGGSVGTLEYQWYSSTTSDAAGFGEITGATNATYDPGVLSLTTWYKRLSKVTCLTEWPVTGESNVLKMTVDPVSVGGTVGGDATVCAGTNSSLLTLSGQTGNVVKWQYFASGEADWVDLTGATATTYTATNLTVTTQYRAVIKSGTCAMANSLPATVTVNPASVGGTVTGGTVICSGNTSGLLTLSGQTGAVLRWQSGVLVSGSWSYTNIANTLTTYTSGTLTQTTRFRAVVKSGNCAQAISAATTVTVNPPTVGGTVTGGTLICTGTTSGVLTLSGHTGTVVKWQSSVDPFTSWTDIVHSGVTYTSGALTATTQFRAVVQSGVCSPANSGSTTVTAEPPARRYLTVAGAGTRDGSSWANAYDGTQLQTAINYCASEVWVAAGTYFPTMKVGGTGDRFKTFQMKNGVAIYGGFAGTENNLEDRNITTNVTILSGNIGALNDSLDNCYHVLYHPASFSPVLTSTAILDGFTVSGGTANAVSPHNSGGGMFNIGQNPTISNCIFNNNYGFYGGGMRIHNASPTVTNCTFFNNRADDGGGVFNSAGSVPVFTSCTFNANRGESGGGLQNDNSDGTYTSCTFTANTATTYGGGVQNRKPGSPSFLNCKFQQNTAAIGGAGILNDSLSTPLYAGCLITNNTAGTYAGGMLNYKCNTIVNNTTFSLNQANYGGGVFNDLSTTNLNNCIIWGNTGTEAKQIGSSASDVTLVNTCYSNSDKDVDVDPAHPGTFVTTNVITANPRFANFSNDFRIASCSPCRDAGLNAFNSLAFDIRGQVRVQNTIIDMGAYEYTSGIDPFEDPAVAGTLAKTPDATNTCIGTSVSVALTPGTGGNLVDSVEFRTKSGSVWSGWAKYTAAISTTGKTDVEVRTKRTSTYCAHSSYNTVSWSVDPASAGGSVSGGTTVCSGTNSTLLTLSGQTGTILKWQSYTSGPLWDDISGQTSITYTATNLTATTQYRAVVKNGVCSEANSIVATITVDPVTVGGSVTGGQHVCTGTNSTLLTLGGQTGTVQKWQYSINSGTDWSDITSATNTTYTATNLTATTDYRAVVKSGACSADYSSAATVTVDAANVGGTITGGQLVCSGTNSTLLTLDGQTGAVVKWQYLVSLGDSPPADWVDIIGATTTTYTATNITATTQYRAVVKSGVCAEAYSTPSTITVDPASVGGSVGTSTHVCTGTNSTLLTLTGKTGVVQKWQYSTNSGTDWNDIASATNTTYTATNLTATTDYRAVVKSGTCPEAYSDAATITVDPASEGGNVSGSANVCYGTNSTLLTLYGQTGTVVKWQYTINGTNWFDITSATNTTYTATNLTTTTYFRSVVQSGVCGAAPGGYANVTVRTAFLAPVAGSDHTICWNTTASELTATAATGGTGPYSYQWQISANGTDWDDISGEVSLSLLPGDLYETSYYRILATDLGTPSCATDEPSNVVEITVRDPFTPSELSIAGDISSTCSGTAPGLMTATATLGGSGPPFIYQWQKKTTGAWSNVGTDALTYQSGALTEATQFRLIAFDNGTPGCGSVFSLNDLTVTINPLPAALAGSDTEICEGESTQLGSSAVSGNTYSWISSPVGFTSTEADPTVSPTVTTTYTVTETITATGCIQSNSVTVTVNPLPFAIAGDDRAICIGGSTVLGNAGKEPSPGTYSWVSDPAVFTSTLATPTVSPTVTTIYTLTETNTTTGCENSNSVTVTVNPKPVAYTIDNTEICLGASIDIGGPEVPGSTYLWSSVPAGFSSTLASPSVSPTVTTIYTVTETITATTCSNTGMVTITVNPLPSASAGSNHAICLNESTQIGAPEVPGSTYLWSSLPDGFSSTLADPTVSPTITTTFTVTETITETGCTNTGTVIVTVNPLPEVNAGADRDICLNESTVLGNDNKYPSPGTYSWSSNPAGFTSTLANPTVSPSVTTTYTLTETITLTGCSNTDEVTVTVNPLPSAIAGDDRDICLGESTTLGAPLKTALNSYSWSSVPPGFTSTLANPTVSPTVTTTYTVVETITATGCHNTHSVIVTVNPLPLAYAGQDRTICLNGNTTLGEPTPKSYENSYSWTSDPAGFTSTLARPTVSPKVTTTYTVEETIILTGCKNTGSVVVTVNPLPSATAGTDREICIGGNTALGATAVSGSTYLWSSAPSGFNSTEADPTVTPSVSTTYTVVETITATGCSNSNSVLVTVNPLPAAAAGSASTICYGSSASIGAAEVPGSTYSWVSDPIGFSSSLSGATVTPTTTTTYTVTETVTATGCVNTGSVTVIVRDLFVEASVPSDQQICYNTAPSSLVATAASGGTGPYSYQWEWSSDGSAPWTSLSGATTLSYSPGLLGSTTYYRILTTDEGTPSCGTSVASGSVEILVNDPLYPSIVSIAGSTEICINATPGLLTATEATGGTGPFTYQWQQRLTTTNPWSNIGPNAVGNTTFQPGPATAETYYRVIAKDIGVPSCGSTFSNVVYVTLLPIPAAEAGSDALVCAGESAQIGAAAVPGSTYSWSSVPPGFSSTESNPEVNPTVTTIYTVEETITSSGCTNTNDVTVTVNPLPDATTGADQSICLGENTDIGAAEVAGSTYQWSSDPAGFTSTEANPTVNPDETTIYSLTETITVTGCTNTNSVTVTVNPLPEATTGTDQEICLNESADLGAAEVSGNTYLWSSDPVGFTSTLSNPTVSPTATTTYSLTETITATGCTNTNSVTVTVNPLPDATTGDDRDICLGEDTYIGSGFNEGSSYSWVSDPVGFISSLSGATVTPTTTTTYTLTETINETGCTNTNSVTVTVNPLPDATAGADRDICFGESTTLGESAVPGNSYSWSSAPSGFTSTEADPLVSPIETTTYTLTETITGTGCTNTNSVTVTVNPLPLAIAGDDREICLGESTILGAGGKNGNVSTFSWTSSPGSFTSTEANPEVSPTETTTYTLVETITETGCTNTNDVTVTVNPLPDATTGADQSICLNESADLGASEVAGNTYLWSSVPVGFNSTLSNPTVSPTATTTYSLTETITATGCTNTNDVTVTVNPRPDAPGVTDLTICSGATATLTASGAVSGDLYKWYDAAISGTLLKTSTDYLDNTYTTDPITTTTDYWVSLSTSNGCEGSLSQVTVTPNGNLSAGAISGDQTICSGFDPMLISNTTLGTGDGIISYIWEASVSPFSSWDVIAGATGSDYDPPSGLTATTKYRRITSSLLNSVSCTSVATEPVTVTVNERQKISGTVKYYNLASTILPGVTINLYLAGEYGTVLGTTTSSSTGYYEFANMCPDLTYEIIATSTRPTAEAVNTTDAAQVNGWGVSPTTIEKVKFYAGDVGTLSPYEPPNGELNATDASRIQQNFVNGKAFDRLWTFWRTGQFISNNPATESYPSVTLEVGLDATANLWGLVTGDFNRSFIPGAKSAGSSSLSLIYTGPVQAAASQAFDLPIHVVHASSVGAVSLILNLPSDLVEVRGVEMSAAHGKLDWAVEGDELRIGWHSTIATELSATETLLTLNLVTKSGFVQGRSIRVSLAGSSLNELADAGYNVIADAVLSVDAVESSTNGIVDPVAAVIAFMNYPNPFAGYTTLAYTLPESGKVSIEIRNTLGQVIKTLVNDNQSAGDYTVKLDAAILTPGVYTATLRLNGNEEVFVRTIKIVRRR